MFSAGGYIVKVTKKTTQTNDNNDGSRSRQQQQQQQQCATTAAAVVPIIERNTNENVLPKEENVSNESHGKDLEIPMAAIVTDTTRN